VLKPQDILILLKLSGEPPSWTFDSIAHELGLSQSAVHRSLQRAGEAGLYDGARRRVKPGALLEFLSHGLKYVFPPVWAGEARGRPTAWGAPPMSKALLSSGHNLPVWPDAHGEARGIALQPLHSSVLDAVRKDKDLWEFLALVDSLRIGNARERNLAEKKLKKKLGL
jgi:DNA-binding Lrp family transcriptional regulator